VRIVDKAGGSLINIVTIAFSCPTFGGVPFANSLNRLLPKGKKINPCIGAADMADTLPVSQGSL